MVFDTAKLKGRIVEKYGSQDAFAQAVNKNKAYISLYMNGKVYLNQKTMDEWMDKLDIQPGDIFAYFFKKKVHETEQ